MQHLIVIAQYMWEQRANTGDKILWGEIKNCGVSWDKYGANWDSVFFSLVTKFGRCSHGRMWTRVRSFLCWSFVCCLLTVDRHMGPNATPLRVIWRNPVMDRESFVKLYIWLSMNCAMFLSLKKLHLVLLKVTLYTLFCTEYVVAWCFKSPHLSLYRGF